MRLDHDEPGAAKPLIGVRGEKLFFRTLDVAFEKIKPGKSKSLHEHRNCHPRALSVLGFGNLNCVVVRLSSQSKACRRWPQRRLNKANAILEWSAVPLKKCKV
jgi:hypothetical protein